MEERCDQVLDCSDRSDEVDCRTVILSGSYRAAAPPVALSSTARSLAGGRLVLPAGVTVSLALLDISAIREADNEIDIKFNLELLWRESRAIFHNLKVKISQNSIDAREAENLWIPNLIYRNNKENDDTRSERSKLKIRREGNFTRSSVNIVDEIEIFEGRDNPIEMHQSYTKTFKCTYDLVMFPFDTQVTIFI